jgi:COP9 signalosome complex subunit 3
MQEKNLGLIKQAIARAPQWILKKLTATYVTLGLEEIGKAVKISDLEEVRRLIVNMVSNPSMVSRMCKSCLTLLLCADRESNHIGTDIGG